MTDLLCKLSPKPWAINGAEEVHDVRFEVLDEAPGDELMHFANYGWDATIFTLDVGEAAWQIELIERWLNVESQCLHNDAVPDSGNLKWSRLGRSGFEMNAGPEPAHLIRAFPEFLTDLSQVPIEVRRKGFYRHTVAAFRLLPLRKLLPSFTKVAKVRNSV